jgi:hypothetical protein
MRAQESFQRRIQQTGFFVLACLVFGCGGSTKPGDSNDDGRGPADLAGGVESAVVAAEGAVLIAAGISAEIPPGALPEDMTVALIPVRADAAEGEALGAARFEPEGTVLLKPITLRFPLPADWNGDETPIVFEFMGNDPEDAVETGAYARVTGSAGHYVAEVLVSHFSGAICAQNCHAGTMRFALERFVARGCSRDSLLAGVRRGYPDVPVSDEECGERSVETVQAFLDTYFDDIGGFNAGQPVPGELLTQMSDFVREGREVVLAFKPGQWGSRGAPHDFYPTEVREYSHTAALELVDGEVQIRNTLATDNPRLIQALGGENLVHYPVDGLNEFRNMPTGVAVELAACGEPDCLSDASRNALGIEMYPPIGGVSYSGGEWSNPWDYVDRFKSWWSGVPPRGIPWSAVRIYVEKPEGLPAGACTCEQVFSADVNLGWDYDTRFEVNAGVLGGFGVMNDVTGYPLVVGSPDPVLDPTTLENYDFISIMLNKTLPGPGDYTFTDTPVGSWSALLWFTSPSIRNADHGDLVAFQAVSGDLTLQSYSTILGGQLKGTYSVSLVGVQTVPGDSGFEQHLITGTASGHFQAVITDDTWGAPVAPPVRMPLRF